RIYREQRVRWTLYFAACESTLSKRALAKKVLAALRSANGHAGDTGDNRSLDARDDRAAGEQGARNGACDSSRAHPGGHPQPERLRRPDGERRVELRRRNPVGAQERAHGAARQAARAHRVKRKGTKRFSSCLCVVGREVRVGSARGGGSTRLLGGRAFLLCGGALARLLGLGLLFLSGELDHRHHRRVAAAMAELDHPGVAAVAILEARRDLVEQLLDRVMRLQRRERAATRGEIVLLAERDHPVRDSRRSCSSHMRSSSPRGGRFSSRIPSERPMSARTSLISLRDLRPKFLILSMSCSVRCTSSPIYLMSAFCRPLKARTEIGSPSTGR